MRLFKVYDSATCHVQAVSGQFCVGRKLINNLHVTLEFALNSTRNTMRLLLLLLT